MYFPCEIVRSNGRITKVYDPLIDEDCVFVTTTVPGLVVPVTVVPVTVVPAVVPVTVVPVVPVVIVVVLVPVTGLMTTVV